MITKFKLFENINEGKPEIGDYVILDDIEDLKFPKYRPMHIFDSSKMIGQIIKIYNTLCYNKWADVYSIQYFAPKNSFQYWDSTTDNLKQEIKPAHLEHIIYWSKNKEDLEHILTANKYNL